MPPFFNFVIKALLQELASCNCTLFPIFDVYMYQVIPRTRFYLFCIVQVVTPVISNLNWTLLTGCFYTSVCKWDKPLDTSTRADQ